MDVYFTTLTPLVVAETWVVAVVSVAIISCFVFLVVLLVLSHRAKSAIPKLHTNVRRKIFYAEPKEESETKVTSSTTNFSNQSAVPYILNSVVPYAPVAMVPPPPRPRPLIFERVRKVYVPTPVPVPTPVSYYPGRMFANNMPRRYYPFRPII